MKKFSQLFATLTFTFALALSGSGIFSLLTPNIANADTTVSASHVIINEVKLGGATNASIPTEYITLFNPTAATISLDGWKIEYAKSGTAVTCQNSSWGVTASQVTSLSGTLGSNQLSTPIVRSLTDTKDGSLHLVDDSGVVMDMVGWGSAAPCYETTAAVVPANDKSIERNLDCAKSLPVDSDNNSADFALNSAPNPSSLSGKYATTCQQPAPATNSGNSGDIPTTNTVQSSTPTCEGAIITELLPNPAGTDTGKEFIELYNPTNAAISLDGCSLQTSANSKKYNFSGVILQPNEYKALNDSQTGLTLPNASGGTVWLLSPTDELQSITYPADVADNVSWDKIGGTWELTYSATPNAANILQANEPCPANEYRDTVTNRCRIIVSASTLVPCKPNQVRNPSTNRCKSLLAVNSTLTPCKPGQYRNPETNRCKSNASTAESTLTPCKPGKERNPETNRCRNIQSSGSTLKACAAGQIRNAETNRCRKDTSANLASVKDVNSTPTSNSSHVQWLIGIGILLAAAGYAIYEWRQDIFNFVDKTKAKIPFLNQTKPGSKLNK
ncbi:MAG TPA: lamin tail domain-containing protein [Candidatus Saccharimonadales bacterium]|nr:lamin tail domain-containing protein [Candidatus Saccharimonadales bacterium]